MPMKSSTRLVNILLTNIPIALSISMVASYLGLSSAGIPADMFWGAFWRSVGLNFLMSYAISFFVGLLIPSVKWGMAFAGALGAKPGDGLKFGLLLNVVVNFVYVVVNDVILTYVNAIVMQGAPLAAYLPAVLGGFVPCYVVGYIVSFLWAPVAERCARSICKDPVPEARHQ